MTYEHFQAYFRWWYKNADKNTHIKGFGAVVDIDRCGIRSDRLDDLVLYYCNHSALAMELLQSCAEPSICRYSNNGKCFTHLLKMSVFTDLFKHVDV